MDAPIGRSPTMDRTQLCFLHKIILDFEKAYANQVKNNDEMEFEYYH